MCYFSILEPSSWKKKNHRRPLHYVLKIGSLKANIEFFKQFGYTLFRHEEFEEGCEASCNGPYGGTTEHFNDILIEKGIVEDLLVPNS